LLLTLTLPKLGEHMTTAVIKTLYGAPGTLLLPGSKLLDLSVDLSALIPQDCPPIALYRIALRERVWLRELAVTAGDEIPVAAPLARFSTDPDESLDAFPERALRVTIAGIVDASEWWGEKSR
jgi:hypothetical protein